MHSVRIAICIPTRNQSGLIKDALCSAFDQTIAPVDVVVSDDAGTDDTKEEVENFRQSLPSKQRCLLRYERSPVQLGIGGNFDRAVRLAQGDFVVKLDSDDILEPQFIEVLSSKLHANPLAGWAHSNVLNVRRDLSPIALAHTRKKSGYYSPRNSLEPYLKHNDTCHCVLIRKSAYLAVGGYRPEMKTAEDWLLWLEMLLGGWGYVFDDRPLAKMRKYEARPELMTKRRNDFVVSMRFMKNRLAQLLHAKLNQDTGLDGVSATRLFNETASRLCINSGCDEADAEVRKMLFDTACEFSPSLKNKLYRTFGLMAPVDATRFLMKASALPRQCARTGIQKLRNNPST